MLDDLVTAIQTVQQRIREHGTTLSQNEYRTRLALIDPYLTRSGWDVSDPVFVTPEDYQAGNGRADYALLGQSKVSRGLSLRPSDSTSLGILIKIKFSNTLGTKSVLRWPNRRQPMGFGGMLPLRFQVVKGRLLDVTISQETAYQCALKLLLIWRPTFATGQPIEANEPVFATSPEPEVPDNRSTPSAPNTPFLRVDIPHQL